MRQGQRRDPDLPHATASINAIGTAVPTHDIHRAFVRWAEEQIESPRERSLFRRMADRSGIAHRWSVLPPTPEGGCPVDPGGFYAGAVLPGTGARMALYGETAPRLALEAIADLERRYPLGRITHLVVASCTGFIAPGVDQIIAAALGLPSNVERTLVGFMGCYAATIALRTARHIVRSEPTARVLVVTVEISSMHLQPERNIEALLAMLQFADGAAAALVSADSEGLALERFFSANLPQSESLIRWTIGDQGFAMHLSGEVPGRITQALADPQTRASLLDGEPVAAIDGWAVHAGGRSILDAVEHGLGLGPHALAPSRGVLHDFGNMSSTTLLFVLARLLSEAPIRQGRAMAFGPGLAVEGFAFASAR
jgi:predicted naringenin-chalcone synthase